MEFAQRTDQINDILSEYEKIISNTVHIDDLNVGKISNISVEIKSILAKRDFSDTDYDEILDLIEQIQNFLKNEDFEKIMSKIDKFATSQGLKNAIPNIEEIFDHNTKIDELDKICQTNPNYMKAIQNKLEKQINRVWQESTPDDAFLLKFNETLQNVISAHKRSASFQKKYLSNYQDNNLQGYQFFAYGSTVNHTQNNKSSDQDITFILNDFNADHEAILKDIRSVLEKHQKPAQRYKFQPKMPRKDSSGWILRFYDKITEIDVDIMVNKYSELQNSLLIAEYVKIDIRFLKLVQILKTWNKSLTQNPFDRLNNFSIYLMLIAFMQHLNILPNLQHFACSNPRIVKHQIQVKFEDRDLNCVDAHNTFFLRKNQDYFEKLGIEDLQTPEITAAEILIKFFRFYGLILNPDHCVIDVSQLKYQESHINKTKSQLQQSIFSGDPFYDREEAIEIISQRLEKKEFIKYISQIKITEKPNENYKKLAKYIKSNMIDKNYGQTYLVLDPFNHAYNPAKGVKKNSKIMMYPLVFQKALQDILRNGLDRNVLSTGDILEFKKYN